MNCIENCTIFLRLEFLLSVTMSHFPNISSAGLLVRSWGPAGKAFENSGCLCFKLISQTLSVLSTFF